MFNLLEITLTNNPITRKQAYRPMLINRCPRLNVADSQVSEEGPTCMHPHEPEGERNLGQEAGSITHTYYMMPYCMCVIRKMFCTHLKKTCNKPYAAHHL